MNKYQKLPPHDIDAEEALIGSVLCDPEIFDGIQLDPSDFFDIKTRTIWQAMKDCQLRNVVIDQITVANALGEKGQEVIGGVVYLGQLYAAIPTSLDAPHYAEIIRRLSIDRQLITASRKIEAIGYEANPNVDESLIDAVKTITDIQHRSIKPHVISPEERATHLFARYSELANHQKTLSITTGLTDLDRILGGGLSPGWFVIVGGLPGMGKTSFGETVARAATKHGPVLIASGEMTADEISDREAASETGISVNVIRSGNWSNPAILDSLLGKVVGKVAERELWIYDATEHPFNTNAIQSEARNLQAKRGLSLVLIDYIGLLDDHEGERGVTDYIRMGIITRALKRMARQLEIPVVALHQLNRESNKRDDKRPMIADLRDSGKIEADADLILFPYHDSYFNNEEMIDPSILVETQIIVAKNRHGQKGFVPVLWDGKNQQYRNKVR